jgi:predicted dienelactone hydrolase
MRFLAACALAACATETPPEVARDPAADGPWRVGVTTIEAPDPAGSGMLTIEIWYPARPAPTAPPEVALGIPTIAVRDAPPDLRGAPFPLVGFSHGRGGMRIQSVYVTQHLASWGYIVVAPDHPHDTLGSSNDDRPAVLRARPHQVSASLDAAIADPMLAGMIDADRIGVLGHSFGAFTALVLAGAKLDLAALTAACVQDPDQLVCSGLDANLTQAVIDGFADPRIDAAVALAPAGRIAFGASGLAAAAPPVQLQGGTDDHLATAATEVEPMFDALTGAKSLGMIDHAAHFSFTDICVLYNATGGAAGPLAFLATEGCGPETLPVDRAHAASRALAVAFFDLHLRDVPDAHGYLDPTRGVADATVR